MGARTERLLLEDLADLDLTGIRVDIRGAAGYTSGHDAGDIIVGRTAEIQLPSGPYEYHSEVGSDLYVIEEKYSSSEEFPYIQEQDGDKIDAMIEFAENIGATPVLAARWSTRVDWSPGSTHYLKDIREVRRTDANSINLKPETAEEEYETPGEFFSAD